MSTGAVRLSWRHGACGNSGAALTRARQEGRAWMWLRENIGETREGGEPTPLRRGLRPVRSAAGSRQPENNTPLGGHRTGKCETQRPDEGRSGLGGAAPGEKRGSASGSRWLAQPVNEERTRDSLRFAVTWGGP
ncbi:hypothetical protein NDU88_003015 [Pleurodeles waltl]|uniref:Uncharacterized protein n=1 Tax=Pleurodeles waltl TaxID=8319 RepID=A0AAV7L504_PLEWA|nr:hypothetical protein NDU88_003015 [Pleurodeles waltl]